MLIIGVFILIAMGSFILGVIVFLLQLLAVAIGIILVLGGIAALVVGSRWKRFWRGNDLAVTET
jgi:uncharacterized protein YjeT (DUF2065 family)